MQHLISYLHVCDKHRDLKRYAQTFHDILSNYSKWPIESCGSHWALWEPLRAVGAIKSCGSHWELWEPLSAVGAIERCGSHWELWEPLSAVGASFKTKVLGLALTDPETNFLNLENYEVLNTLIFLNRHYLNKYLSSLYYSPIYFFNCS